MKLCLFLGGDSGTLCRVADGEGPKNAIIEDYTKKMITLLCPSKGLGSTRKNL